MTPLDMPVTVVEIEGDDQDGWLLRLVGDRFTGRDFEVTISCRARYNVGHSVGRGQAHELHLGDTVHLTMQEYAGT